MISLKIKDINIFMQKLLIADTFDDFLLCDGEIAVSNIITFNGRINPRFFSSEEQDMLVDDFIYWKDFKHIAVETIKGSKVPSRMKLVFALSKTKYESIISKSGMNLPPEQVGGLYLHVLYEDNHIEVITGVSLNTFTMDKTLDKYWDETIVSFLNSHFQCEML